MCGEVLAGRIAGRPSGASPLWRGGPRFPHHENRDRAERGVLRLPAVRVGGGGAGRAAERQGGAPTHPLALAPPPRRWTNYFLHSGHLHQSGLKMSKSLKNFIKIADAGRLLRGAAAAARVPPAAVERAHELQRGGAVDDGGGAAGGAMN